MNHRIHKSGLALILAAGLAVAGCSGAEEKPAQEQAVVVPGGTALVISLNAPVSSEDMLPGSMLYGMVDQPVVVDGKTVVEAGQAVALEVVEVQASEDGAPATITLEVASIEFADGTVEVAVSPLEVVGATTEPASPDQQAVTTAVLLSADQKLRFSTTNEIQVPRG